MSVFRMLTPVIYNTLILYSDVIIDFITVVRTRKLISNSSRCELAKLEFLFKKLSIIGKHMPLDL